MNIPGLQDREDNRPEYLSHSRINRYLTCPQQYWFYYVQRLRPRYAAAVLVFGQAVHQSLAALFSKGADPVKHFLEIWNTITDFPLRYNQRDSWERLKNCGEALLGKFVAEELPKLKNPVAIEKKFELNVSGFDTAMIGVVDLVTAEFEGKRTLVDFKTSGSSYDPTEAHLSDQLTAYQLAEPNAEQLALCVLVKTKEPKIEWHLTNRTSLQLSEYLAKAGYIAQQITNGQFYKRPGMWCSWCDFRPLCAGQFKKAEQTLVRMD